jgi:hypothetical protein
VWKEQQQLDVIEVVDCWAFVRGDPGDGGVGVDSKCKVDVLWQWGDEVASVGETVDKYGEEVNFKACAASSDVPTSLGQMTASARRRQSLQYTLLAKRQSSTCKSPCMS